MDKSLSEYLFQFYGTDWLAVACMCIYLWRVGNKKRDAFIWGAISSASFVALNIQIQSPPGIVFNAIFIALYARAFMKWASKAKPDNNNCLFCDYSLEGLPATGKCPECGKMYSFST